MGDIEVEDAKQVGGCELGWKTTRPKTNMADNLYEGLQSEIICLVGDFEIHDIFGCLVAEDSLDLGL